MKNLNWSVYDFLNPHEHLGTRQVIQRCSEQYMSTLKIALWEEMLVHKEEKHIQKLSLGKQEMEMIQDTYIHKLPVDSLFPPLQVYLAVVSSKSSFSSL